mgnify:CR=1 FL=1
MSKVFRDSLSLSPRDQYCIKFRYRNKSKEFIDIVLRQNKDPSATITNPRHIIRQKYQCPKKKKTWYQIKRKGTAEKTKTTRKKNQRTPDSDFRIYV